jgi:predicted DNA-binding antitoxin AbrB/MazE fold protein
MGEQFEAVVDHGVLKPVVPLNLPENSRVRLTVIQEPVPVETAQPPTQSGSQLDSFDAELESLLFSGPSLPPDFSRADIYADHD